MLKAFFHTFQQVKLKKHFIRELQSFNLVFSSLLVEKLLLMLKSIVKSSKLPMGELVCKQSRERDSAFPTVLSTVLLPHITNKSDHQRLVFDFSRPLPVSEEQYINHLPLSFTPALYHVIM